MKCSELILRLQIAVDKYGDPDVVLGTLTDDCTHMSFYEEPKALVTDIPEDDDGKEWRRVMLIGWDEVFVQPDPERPKLRSVK